MMMEHAWRENGTKGGDERKKRKKRKNRYGRAMSKGWQDGEVFKDDIDA